MGLLGVTAAVVFAAVGALVGIALHDPALYALYGFLLGTLVSVPCDVLVRTWTVGGQSRCRLPETPEA